MTYTVYQRGRLRGRLVGTFDTYSQANKIVLVQSGKGRIWEAVGFHMTSTKIQLKRVLVESNIAVSDIGPRKTAHTSWRSLYHTLNDAVWWMPPNTDLFISLIAEFESGFAIPSSLSFSRNASEPRSAITHSQVYDAFDHIAETHEITDYATDWPQ